MSNSYQGSFFARCQSLPFIAPAPDRESKEIERGNWRSGELQGLIAGKA